MAKTLRCAISDTEEREPARLWGRRGSERKTHETRTGSLPHIPRSYLGQSYLDRDLLVGAVQANPSLAGTGSVLGSRTESRDAITRPLRRRAESDAVLFKHSACGFESKKHPASSSDLRTARRDEIGRLSKTPLARRLYTRSHKFISRPLQQRSSPDVLYTSTPPQGGQGYRHASQSFLSLSVGKGSLLTVACSPALASSSPSNETERKLTDSQEEKMKDRRPATASGALPEGRSSHHGSKARVAKPSPPETESRHAASTLTRLRSHSRPNLVPPKGSKGDAEMKKDELSTADRKLLSSLRRNLSAQQSQFVMKNGKKHHRFPPREVPYPQSYERLVLDHEMWEALFYQQLIGGVCIHQYEKPPAKALDLGCGTGAWILHAARVWKQTHFVGLDIVPLQPNLKRVGPSDLARRVTWVHANFLEKLPFPDDEFDFVMIKRIARAVPEDKSDALFEEVYRVMKPGAIIELIEEDLYFPGSVTDPVIYASDDPSSAVSGPSSSSRYRSSSNASTHSLGSHQASPVSAAPPVPKFTQRRAKKLSDPTEHIPTSMVGPSRAHASASAPGVARTRSGSIPPVPDSGADGNPADGQKAQGSHPDTSPVLPHHEQNIPDSSSSAHLSPSQIPPVTTSPSNRRSGFFGGHSLLRRKSHSRGKGSSPTTHSQAAFQLMEAYTRGRSYTETMPPSTFAIVNMLGSTPPTHTITLPAIDTSTDTIAIDISKSPIEPPASASVGGSSEKSEKRSLSAEEGADDKGRMSGEPEPRPSLGSLYHADHPVLSANPRDHSLLERIYREMHAERFINLTPLSLLPAQLDRYFSHVQSNAPISFAFPPRTQRRSAAAVEDGAQIDLLDPASIVRLQHSKITASPSRPGSLQQRSRHPSFSVADDSGTATSVLSQYVLVDSARMPAVHARPRPHISTESINSTTSVGTIKRTGSHSASSSTSSANLLRGVKRAADTPVKRPPSAFSGVGTGAGTGGAGVGTGVGGSGTGLRLAVGARSLEIDLKSLHLHLATRVAETMACAEAMWEWVCREQMRAVDASATVTPLRRAIEKPVDPQLMAIRTLTRADFDACVARFGMDMHDNTALGYALEHHLGATPGPAGIGSSRSHERLSFDAACAQWDAVVAEQQAGDVQTGDDAGGADSQHTASDFGAASITRRLSRSIRIFHGVKE